MIYEVSHRTLYRYQSPVTQSQHLLHLAPAPAPRQSVLGYGLLVEPAPTSRAEFTDYFGNPSAILGIDAEHTEMSIHMRATVDVAPRGALSIEEGTAWEDIGAAVRGAGKRIDIGVLQFSLPSPATYATAEIRAYAEASFTPGRPLLSATRDLTRRIHRDFVFDPTATEVTTPVAKTFKDRRGVCQDFAHLALACLRALRVPARYVSGYLMTRPPPGKPKLQGADASHAWIAVWTPEAGWVDFDPTNDSIPDDEHIAFAFGREYRDISPISGILLGGGSHSVQVAVDVSAKSG